MTEVSAIEDIIAYEDVGSHISPLESLIRHILPKIIS
jgi:hypothetical protein